MTDQLVGRRDARVAGKTRGEIGEQGARHPRDAAAAGGEARDLQRGGRGLGAEGGICSQTLHHHIRDKKPEGGITADEFRRIAAGRAVFRTCDLLDLCRRLDVILSDKDTSKV